MADPKIIETAIDTLPSDWRYTPVTGKRPLIDGWQNRPFSKNDVICEIENARWTGIGFLCGVPSGGLVSLDHDGESCDRLVEQLSGQSLADALPHTVNFTSGKIGRYQAVYRVPEEFWSAIATTKKSTGITGPDGKMEQLEFRWTGCQSVVCGIHPDTQQPYQWMNSPVDTPIADAPMWLIEQMLTAPPSKTASASKPKPAQSVPPALDTIPLIKCISPRHRDLIASGEGEGSRDNSGAAIARDLIGTQQHLRAMGQPFDGDARSYLENYADRCTPPLTDRDVERIWKSAEKSTPSPCLSDDKITGCIDAFFKRGQRSSSIADPTTGEPIELRRIPTEPKPDRPNLVLIDDGRWRASEQINGSRPDATGRVKQIPQTDLRDHILSQWDGNVIFNIDLMVWMRYDAASGLWRSVTETEIRAFIQTALCGAFEYKLIAQTYKMLGDHIDVCVRGFVSDRDVVVFRNGVLNLKTQHFGPHDRKHHATWGFDRDYEPFRTDFRPIAKWLTCAIADPVQRDSMVAFHAAVVRDLFVQIPSKNKKNMLLQTGASGSGKGTSIRLLTKLIGISNTMSFNSIGEIGDDIHSLDGLQDRNPRVILFPDQDPVSKSDKKGLLKLLKITGFDVFSIRPLHKKPIDFQFSGGCIINSTEFIFKPMHRSMGTTRRGVLIDSWRDDPELSGIEFQFTDEILMGYLNYLLSIPAEWIIATLENSPGEPSIERDSLNNPMTAWALDHLEFTGNPADKIQCGNKKTHGHQLFGNFFAHCQDSNINHSPTHTSFANEFEKLFDRLTGRFQTGGLTFDKIRPSNAIHYRGIRFKETPDDTSRMEQFRDQAYPSIDSPVQAALAAQLAIDIPHPHECPELEPEIQIDDLFEYVEEPSPDATPIDCEFLDTPPPPVPDWVPAIGEPVAMLTDGLWRRGQIVTVPNASKNPIERSSFYKIELPTGQSYAHDISQIRPLFPPQTSREVAA